MPTSISDLETLLVSRKLFDEIKALIQTVAILGSGMKINPEMDDLAKRLVVQFQKEGL